MATGKTSAVPADDRRSRRTDVRVPVRIAAGMGPKIEAFALNVSAHGVMLETDVPFVPGRPLTLELPGLPGKAARIAWVRDGHIGVAFAQPLTLDELLAIV